MDTRFWGPSGWALLHLIAATPIEPRRRAKVKEWFELLEYVLPCKYCRASFHDYMVLDPFSLATVADPDAFGHWLYDIHNRVNAKLKGQGLLTQADPTWPAVKAKYAALSRGLCQTTPLLGWDFLTSIAFTTPGAHYKPTPMDDAPEEPSKMNLRTRNRYNLLTKTERITALKRWWSLIPSILPCPAWRASWSAAAAVPIPLTSGREPALQWMWRVEEGVCANLKCPTPHSSLPAMKSEVSAYESKCSTQKRGKTCRTRKHRLRLQARQARRTRMKTVLAAAVAGQ